MLAAGASELAWPRALGLLREQQEQPVGEQQPRQLELEPELVQLGVPPPSQLPVEAAPLGREERKPPRRQPLDWALAVVGSSLLFFEDRISSVRGCQSKRYCRQFFVVKDSETGDRQANCRRGEE